MAERRMFNTRLTTNSDSFHDLSAVQRSLFFDLLGSADDYGMVGNLNQVISYAGRGTKKSDGQALIDKGYLIDCQDGFYAITDWYRHNYKSVVNQKESREDILKSLQRHLITLDEKDRFIKVSADFFLSDTANRVVKSSEEKNSKDKVSGSTDMAAAAATDRTTTTDEQRLNDIISLWNDNPATVNITAADIENNANSLSELISKYTYPDLMNTIFHLADKRYFAEDHNVDFPFFLKEYGKIKSGKYDTPKAVIPLAYLNQYSDWIETKCALTYGEHTEQKRIEKERADKAAEKAAEERAAAEEQERAEQERAKKERAEQDAKQDAERKAILDQWKKENKDVPPDATWIDFVLAQHGIKTK